VRAEHWSKRVFYASQCRFFLDVPLDMSGLIANAQRDAAGHGHVVVPGGMVLATDAIFRGAVLVEIEDPGGSPYHVIRIDGEVLGRDLPPKGMRLRGELEELVRWASDLGLDVNGSYVEYRNNGTIPGVARAVAVYATVLGEERITDLPKAAAR
jgi:hypothetical protein